MPPIANVIISIPSLHNCSKIAKSKIAIPLIFFNFLHLHNFGFVSQTHSNRYIIVIPYYTMKINRQHSKIEKA